MNRRQFVEKCFQRAEALRTTEPLYRSLVSQLFQWLLLCDQAEADQTTQALGIQGQVSASVRARQSGVVAGVEEVLLLLGQYPGVAVGQYCRDSSPIEAGEALLTFSLDAATLLRLERVVLNVLGRMSGIATQTRHLVQQASSDAVSVAATRKTPWMLLDKKAVACGGGLTHRLNLADAILIKDNHLIAFQRQQGLEVPEQIIREVVLRALAAPGACFELEVEGRRQAMAALATFEHETANNAGATPSMILMLDNFRPAEARALVERIREMPIYEQVLLEASGDITEATLAEWAATGVDVVSLGALTHSTRNFNLSLELH